MNIWYELNKKIHGKKETEGDRRGPKHERGAIWDWKEGEKCTTYAAKGKNEGKDGKRIKKRQWGKKEEILQFLKKNSILIKKSKE